MAVAFFDLDKTLIAVNSASLWLRYEMKAGRVSKLDAAKASWAFFRYAAGSSKIESSIRSAIALVAGSPAEDLQNRFRSFYQATVRSLYRPGALDTLEKHRSQGDFVVLLSSTPIDLADAVAEDLKLDGALGTILAKDETGLLTGQAVEPLCFGAGKIVWAQRWLEAKGESLTDATFYTDSASDAPMLRAVRYPIVVHPDPALKRLAVKNNWPMQTWGKPVV